MKSDCAYNKPHCDKTMAKDTRIKGRFKNFN